MRENQSRCRVTAASSFAAVLLTTGLAAADAAKPQALVALFETPRVSLPQGPLPNGLRFVLYDDGTIITRADPTPADPDPAGRGVAFGVLDRDAAEILTSDALADLKDAAAKSGTPSLADIGSTILEVWDGGRYRRFSASVWPCQVEGRALRAGIEQRNRDQTDPHLLKVCDRLLQYKIPNPQPWTPKAVELRIGAQDGKSDRKIDWPKSWPAAPIDLKPKAATAFCAPVSADPSDFSNTLVTARWGEIGRTEIAIDANTSAVIWDWYFDLPAEIPIVNEKGEPELGVGSTCAEVARP
jgi:hypothetical protein